MLHPQLCWFFHILLGLVPKPAEKRLQERKDSLRSATFRLAGTAAAVIVGIIIGTHPALAPDKLALSSYLENIPVVSDFYNLDKKKEAKSSPVPEASKPRPVLPGALLIKFHNLDVGKESWQVVFVLDNSKSMASESGPWPTSRLDVARELIRQISEALPSNSRVAVRDFTNEISLKMGSREIPVTVSQIVYGWAEAPFDGLTKRLKKVVPLDRPIDLCRAVVGSSLRDFGDVVKRKPRIVLFTDAGSTCWASAATEIARRGKKNAIGSVDVVALGMNQANKETFAQLSEHTNGVFLDIALPSDVKEHLAHYTSVLQVSKPVTVELSGKSGVKKVTVGEKIELPPGMYSLWLPRDVHVPQAQQKIDKIEVSPESLTTVTLSRQDERLTVTTERR